jgi:CheY-like chemotaxis protein
MHGGTVKAVSEGANRGSTFIVRLPAAEGAAVADTGEIRPRVPPAPGSGRILVVDDNVDAAETLTMLLGGTGYEVRTVPDGEAALAAVDTFAPELAVLDIGLPGMDGYELARRLQANPAIPDLKLVALTGYGRSPDRERALKSGFDEHLVKPVAADRLLEVIGRLLQARVGAGTD